MRLVSLCPSITKLVFDLGLGHDLVGITKYCIHPADEVAAIEKVGGTKDPNLERIALLAPDLILMNREENRKEDWELLQKKGLNCHVSDPDTIDSTIDMVVDFGRVLRVEAKANALAGGIRQAREQVNADDARARGLSWAYLIWRKPWMTINGKPYIHHLITECGGVNVFESLEGPYPAITAQQLADADPTVVFLSSEPFPFKQKHALELAEATSLPLSRFRLVDGELMSWHGCYTEEGLLYTAQQFREL